MPHRLWAERAPGEPGLASRRLLLGAPSEAFTRRPGSGIGWGGQAGAALNLQALLSPSACGLQGKGATSQGLGLELQAPHHPTLPNIRHDFMALLRHVGPANSLQAPH